MADHKCVGCDRMIPSHIERCLFCKDALRKVGICVWCGEKPIESGHTRYCGECKESAKKVAIASRNKLCYSPHHGNRPQDARENTYETKHGTGH